MRSLLLVFSLTILFITGMAQVSVRTLAPVQAVVSTESFQVQYIIQDADKTVSITPPPFSHFRFVTGPNVHTGTISTGNRMVTLQNFAYTLEAERPGSFVIPGAVLTVNGRNYRSNDVLVQVISKKEAANRANAENGINRDYMLGPGENVQEKIKQNLFVKVLVNKNTCYAGEPVMATFKLYSRLESKSDIIKNPGFYGFTVHDMVNLQDKLVSTENVNGRLFDVHTIRQVQLYPLQAGVFSIDAMQIKNRVEFSKSAVSKKSEQEIAEGVLGMNEDDAPAEGTEVYETEISTAPVSITVKPLPEKNKPASFGGAAGRFTITALVMNDHLARNEEGVLEIRFGGKGNFIQLDAPVIQWPAGMEGFEPVVKDSLNKSAFPLAGQRAFRYPFVCAGAGSYTLPAITFSFFDTDSNTFKTVVTKPLTVTISNELKKSTAVAGKNTSIAEQSEKAARTAGLVVVALVLLILIYWAIRKKEKPPVVTEEVKPALPSIASLLQPAGDAVSGEANVFFRELHWGAWLFLAQRFELSGSEMNKQQAGLKMQAAGIGPDTRQQLLAVIEQCEAGVFTGAGFEEDQQALWEHTKELLEKIDAAMS